MRALLLIVALSIYGYAWSDNSDNHKGIAQKNQSTSQKKSSPNFDTTSLEKTIRESIKDAAEKTDAHSDEKLESDRKLVEYTGELSFFTKWLAIATVVLALIAIWQGRLLNRTVDLGREEFISTHRPRLVVRRVSVVENNGIYGIQYFIHNIGDSRATIVKVSDRVWLPTQTENLPAIPDYEESRDMNTILNSGQWMGGLHTPTTINQERLGLVFGYNNVIKEMPSLSNLQEDGGILFLGFIEYEDQVGTTRNTAFLRQFDFKTERFNAINHPDYEYQD